MVESPITTRYGVWIVAGNDGHKTGSQNLASCLVAAGLQVCILSNRLPSTPPTAVGSCQIPFLPSLPSSFSVFVS